MEKKSLPSKDTNVDGAAFSGWQLSPAEFPPLASLHIARVGVDDSGEGYERVRVSPGGSFLMETESGEGRILLEGRWQKLSRGDVAMAPPRALNAFYTPAGRRWKIAFLRYDEPCNVRPMIDARSPLRLSGQRHLAKAIEGLRGEWEKERELSILHQWLVLIDAIARRMARPWQMDERLVSLWDKVAAAPARAWTLPELARLCGLSSEHLRRLCLKSLGRTPMEQITTLRMQIAMERLQQSGEKLDSLAQDLGYANGHAFSRAFQRCIGIPPSSFRSRARVGRGWIPGTLWWMIPARQDCRLRVVAARMPENPLPS